MAGWDDVRRLAMALPDTTEDAFGHGGLQGWKVGGKGFVWERPLRKVDLAALGADAPDGPILGARTTDLEAKDALLADNPVVYFTTPHFTGYSAVLVRLEEIDVHELQEIVTDAWLAVAPKKLAQRFLADAD